MLIISDLRQDNQEHDKCLLQDVMFVYVACVGRGRPLNRVWLQEPS